MQTNAPKRSRRLRFSLTSFLVAITVACIWLAYVSNRARSQKEAVDRITEMGGGVAFDYQLDANANWIREPKLPAPRWLADLVGEDVFRTVAIVNFDEPLDPTNDELAVVAGFTDLKQLTLMGRKRITDDGLRHIKRSSGLEVLALNGTSVRGEGLRHIAHMRNLKGLTLDKTPLTDVGLQYIGQLSKLEWLHLSNTDITDKGMRHLAPLRHLTDLELHGTQITDAGIKFLSGITSLKDVSLGSHVSDEGRSWLQAQLPKCKVH